MTKHIFMPIYLFMTRGSWQWWIGAPDPPRMSVPWNRSPWWMTGWWKCDFERLGSPLAIGPPDATIGGPPIIMFWACLGMMFGHVWAWLVSWWPYSWANPQSNTFFFFRGVNRPTGPWGCDQNLPHCMPYQPSMNEVYHSERILRAAPGGPSFTRWSDSSAVASLKQFSLWDGCRVWLGSPIMSKNPSMSIFKEKNVTFGGTPIMDCLKKGGKAMFLLG